jgi:hypothetical protein
MTQPSTLRTYVHLLEDGVGEASFFDQLMEPAAAAYKSPQEIGASSGANESANITSRNSPKAVVAVEA